MDRFQDWISEDVSNDKNCNLCKEIGLKIGSITDYGSSIIYKIGNMEDGWIATLSPKTGGNPFEDFSIQLMPFAHLTHFAQLNKYPELAKNYGIAFSRVSYALSKIMSDENNEFAPSVDSRKVSTSVATYGKCTNWKEKKEHLHIKIYPFRNNIGQPSPVDSSFGRKEIYNENGIRYIRMDPVKKRPLDAKRFQELTNKLIELLS